MSRDVYTSHYVPFYKITKRSQIRLSKDEVSTKLCYRGSSWDRSVAERMSLGRTLLVSRGSRSFAWTKSIPLQRKLAGRDLLSPSMSALGSQGLACSVPSRHRAQRGCGHGGPNLAHETDV